jgi:Family of unknown function (DUF6364)
MKFLKKVLDAALRNEVSMRSPMKQKLTLNIDDQLIEEIKILAVREKRSLSDLTEDLYRVRLSRQVKLKTKSK